jgi:hypothetical protein
MKRQSVALVACKHCGRECHPKGIHIHQAHCKGKFIQALVIDPEPKKSRIDNILDSLTDEAVIVLWVWLEKTSVSQMSEDLMKRMDEIPFRDVRQELEVWNKDRGE